MRDIRNDFNYKKLKTELDKLSPERQGVFMATIVDEARKEFYSPDEVAVILNKSVGTIRRWLRNGELRANKIGRSWLIPYSEIMRLQTVGQ